MIIKESLGRDSLRIIVWYPLRLILLILPVRLGIKILGLMGDINYAFSAGKKNLLLRNYANMQSGEFRNNEKGLHVVREYFRNYYIDRLLIFIFPRFGLKEIESHVEIEGLEILDRALKEGKGVILAHGHFGPVHLPLVTLSRLGYPIKQVGNPSDEGLSWIGKNVAFRLRMKYEAKMPAEIIKADRFLRPAFRWLAENGVIMITGDGNGTEERIGRHVTISFLSKSILFPLGPALLAGKTGSVIIPIFITPGQNKNYKIIIEKPLRTDKSGEDAAIDITGQFAKRLESYICMYPQYMHFLDRFCPGKLNLKEE